MEVRENFSAAWLDPTHPNYNRWKRSRELSIERGKFVKSVIAQYKQCERLSVLDLGSGEGGTAAVFSENNFVVSLDLSFLRLKRQSELKENKNLINSNALLLPFKNNSFDVIILQDVIEHVPDGFQLLNHLHKILKDNGKIYLSTPNRFSFVNLLSDPHWGLPLISLLKRGQIKYFLRIFRKKDAGRKDTAELLSLKEFEKNISENFNFRINTKFAVDELLGGNKGLVWSGFHLKIISIVKFLKLPFLLKKIANDKSGFVNNFLTPTFYFILTKKS